MGERTTINFRGLLYFVMVFTFLLGGCNNGEKVEEEDEIGLIEETTDQNFIESTEEIACSIETFYDENFGWGYDIYKNGKLVVHQPHIPVINGLQAFSTEEDAMKLGNLVVSKIKSGMLRPSVNMAEIDSLNILIKK